MVLPIVAAILPLEIKSSVANAYLYIAEAEVCSQASVLRCFAIFRSIGRLGPAGHRQTLAGGFSNLQRALCSEDPILQGLWTGRRACVALV